MPQEHQIAKRETTLLEQAIGQEWYHHTIASFLGKDQAADAFIAEIFNQARRVPQLLACSIESSQFVVARIAALHLNPALPNEVFCIPRNTKQPDGRTYRLEMTIQYGYAGLRKLVMRSPEVLDCFTREVCANDFYEPPTTQVVLPTHHLQGRFTPRGRVEGYYAAILLRSGNWRVLSMSVADCETHAKRYVPQLEKSTTWNKGTRPDVEDGLTPFDKMGLKTCLRMLCNGRDVPLSDDVQAAIQLEYEGRETAAELQGYTHDGREPAALTSGAGIVLDMPQQRDTAIAELFGDGPLAGKNMAMPTETPRGAGQPSAFDSLSELQRQHGMSEEELSSWLRKQQVRFKVSTLSDVHLVALQAELLEAEGQRQTSNDHPPIVEQHALLDQEIPENDEPFNITTGEVR